MMKKNIERIKEPAWLTEKIDKIQGFYVHNTTKNLIRVKTDEGTQAVKGNDYQWIWAKSIEKVW